MSEENPEEKENKTENVEIEKGSSGVKASALIPVASIIIMVPLLTYLVGEFVLIPRIRNLINEDHSLERGADLNSETQALGNENFQIFEFEDIVANIVGAVPSQSRYVKVSFTVEGLDPDFKSLMESNRARIIDATLGVLSGFSVTDIQEPGFKNLLRNDLLNTYEIALKKRVIQQLYFSEFVVQ